MRIISEREWTTFQSTLNSVPQTEQEKEKEKLVGELESGLYLIGATAVLDRLQDDVAETIRDLIRASKHPSTQTSRFGCSRVTRWKLLKT